jgi:type II secretory pathway component PulK
MRRRTHHPAYVLPLVLVLLALAAVALQGVVLSAMNASTHSLGAQDELQRRWALTTLQTTLLPTVERTLARAQAARHRPLVGTTASLQLGSQTFELTFSDEQAKANLNTLYDRQPPRELQATLTALQPAGARRLPVELRPLRPLRPRLSRAAATRPTTRQSAGALAAIQNSRSPGGAAAPVSKTAQPATAPTPEEVPPAFETFAQVFPDVTPRDLIGPDGSLATTFTCWGDGRVNVNRATARTLEAVCRPHLNRLEVGRLLAARDRGRITKLSDALAALGLPQERREIVEQLLATESTSHGLWIVTRADGKTLYRFVVVVDGGGDGQKIVHDW